jgi:hypothetical protein
MKKILKRIKTKFLFFILDSFVYSYSAVGLALMLNVNLIAFLVCDILMILIILGSVLRVPDFKVIKISDLAKTNLFLIMVWLFLVSFHWHLIAYYTQFPLVGPGEPLLICQLSLFVLRCCASEFSNYISYNVFMDTLDILEIVYNLRGDYYIVFF